MMNKHYWESKWDDGKYVCKTCKSLQSRCNGITTVRGKDDD